MDSSGDADNKKKDILIIGPMQGLDNTALTAEKEYAIYFSDQYRKLCSNLHYNGVNSLFVNGVEINKFKAKDSAINPTSLYLANVSKTFSTTTDNMKKTELLMSMIF